MTQNEKIKGRYSAFFKIALIALLASLVLSFVVQRAHAAEKIWTGSDYTVKLVETSDSTCTISIETTMDLTKAAIFPRKAASEAVLSGQGPAGWNDMIGSGKNYSYQMSGLETEKTIDFYILYFVGEEQRQTATFVYTMGEENNDQSSGSTTPGQGGGNTSNGEQDADTGDVIGKQWNRSGYSVKLVEKNSSCNVTLTTSASATWAAIFPVTGNSEEELKESVGGYNAMTGGGNTFTHSIAGLSKNKVVKFYVLFNVDGVEKKSDDFYYTFGVSDSFETDGTSSGGAIATGTTYTIEAENYTTMSGVSKGDTTVSSADANDWMRYEFEVPATGRYVFKVKAKASSKGAIALRDGVVRIGEVEVGQSDSMTSYEGDTVKLTAGKQTLTVIVLSGSMEIDCFELVSTNASTNTDNLEDGVELPEFDEEILDIIGDASEDHIIFQFNNKTNGKYADNEIYWCILGYKDGKLCYLDTDGELKEATPEMNTTTIGDRVCADAYICHPLSDCNYVLVPSVESGRMYFSYGEPVHITINKADNGVIGFAGPDLKNTSDPNREFPFEFLEFTIGGPSGPKEYWGNTTRVDNYCFPIVTRLMGEGGIMSGGIATGVYDYVVGDTGSREDILNLYKEQAKDFDGGKWAGLLDYDKAGNPMRIHCPGKGVFDQNYFDNYIDKFWSYYTTHELVFSCEGHEGVTARVDAATNKLVFHDNGTTGYIDKPSTPDVLEGKGAFDRSTPGCSDVQRSKELAIEAQLCAAFNRGLALNKNTADWYDVSKYYTGGENGDQPYNFYSKFLHEHSIDNITYGFCYDDVNDQSSSLYYTCPTALVIDLMY